MHDTKHAIVKGKHNTYSLNCSVIGGKTWPFTPPAQHAVMICSVCHKTRLDIETLKKDKWVIHEDDLE
jgi:hypothetical protein